MTGKAERSKTMDVICLTCGLALERREDGIERGHQCYTWHDPASGELVDNCRGCGAVTSLQTTGPAGRLVGEWREPGEVAAVVYAARGLLRRVDHITTDDFRTGGERRERERLRLALARLLAVDKGEV
jgi:hypothetical protein